MKYYGLVAVSTDPFTIFFVRSIGTIMRGIVQVQGYQFFAYV
jgi:hypothetical protein